jgi:hypothetical protein
MILQLDPPIPLRHVDGRKFLALLVIDYGPDYDLLWTGGFEDSREIWTLPNKVLRVDENISLGRPPIKVAH